MVVYDTSDAITYCQHQRSTCHLSPDCYLLGNTHNLSLVQCPFGPHPWLQFPEVRGYCSMPTPSLKSGEHLRFSVPLETIHIVSVCVN